MARRSQTELAVLGALSTGPMSGYELRRAITEVLGHFWHESFGQIYPCLTALERAGAVQRTGPGRTSGTVFAITAAGEGLLRSLLAQAHTPPPARNGLLLRLFFGSHLPPGTPESLLVEAEQAATRALDEYAVVRGSLADDASREQTLRTITLSFGEHLAHAQLAWAQESLAALAAVGDTGAPRARG
ncbi:MAG TPA: PadR family transcriptional regulator [Ornithinibacter sp.]|nr:PadR family transcriptional regulator [Ornithinibacter sp.]